MKITSLVLEGYKRLMLRNIKKITYTPSHDLQLILGTNGSGKSSLLKELSPMPAQAADFTKDGCKITTFTHKGNNYLVKSTFKNGPKHSFFKNDMENDLNLGGTATVQRDLIRQEIGITAEIMLALQGNIRFTDMSPAMRRQWITMLSATDLTYATQIYNEAKSLFNDSKSVVKHIQNRLSMEIDKLLDYVDIEQQQLLAKQLWEELVVLMENRELGLPSSTETEQSIRSNIQRLEYISKQILEMKIRTPVLTKLPPNHTALDIENAFNEIRQAVIIHESMHESYCNEYAQLDSVLSTLNTTEVRSIEEIEYKIEQLVETEQDLLEKIHHFFIDANVEEVLADTESVVESILPLLSGLPKNIERQYSQKNYEDNKALKERLTDQINVYHNRIGSLENRIDHIRSIKEIQCPDCSYTWKPGVSEAEITQMESNIAEMRLKAEDIGKKLIELKQIIDDTENYVTKLRTVRNIVNSYPRLGELWSTITVDEIIYDNPSDAVPIIHKWISDVKHSVTVAMVRKEYNALNDTLQHLHRLSNNDSSYLKERSETLHSQIDNIIIKTEELKKQAQELKNYRDDLSKINSNREEIFRITQKIIADQEILIKIFRENSIGNLIEGHRNTLAYTQTKINEKDTLTRIVDDLKESLNKVTIERTIYQALSESLSPTDGLIAENLMECIHSVVSHLNNIVASVWTYPLTIKDCSTVDGELDYKFPMSTETNDLIVPDIKEGSSGQVDIINFAFILLCYNHLGLEDFPLYLDEIGKTFDEQHRTNIMNYIKSCVDSKIFSQVFMVSHYAAEHGALSNAEVLVLDGANISVPLVHNQHVILE